MRRNLLRKTEEGTPVFKVFSLFLMAFLAFSGNVWAQTTITSLSQINQANGNYVIASDITGGTAGVSNFTGTLTGQAKTDGTFPVISGLTQPLFTTVTGATISNIMLKNVEISQSGNVGAIACTANGSTKIYNCGILPNNPQFSDTSYVKSVDGYCGGLVGLLDGSARVINCFSFANIKGGTTVAGIVGYNNVASTQVDLATIVMNCMFYGDIDTTQCDFKGAYPVYGGKIIRNDGAKAINNYNYYCDAAKFDGSYKSESRYNCSWPAKVSRLRRFEYYRSILNSNRRLSTFWVTDKKVGDQTPEDTDLIAKWVLDPSIAPYPVLKKWGKYPSIINIDPEKVWDSVHGGWVQRAGAAPYNGRKLGELTITVKTGTIDNSLGLNSRTETVTRVITDMDTTSYDYCYGKVQLPYYNEVFGNPNASDYVHRYYGNYTENVVTAWKITAVTTDGSVQTYNAFVKDWEKGYNFADRYCIDKDIYDKNDNRAFAQGGYYYVPEGVTAITIEAYWGKAFYLQAKDNYLDRVDVAKTKNYGSPFDPAGQMSSTYTFTVGSVNHSIPIYNDFATIMTAVKADQTCNVYEQAIVLLSNFPLHAENDLTGSINNAGKGGVTFMSADLDMDNEPDYCFPFQWRKADNYTRWPIMPFRFDFLPIPELGMAMRHDKYAYSIGIFVPTGYFEITETAFIYTTQYEYMSSWNNPINHQKPLILNGGQYEQIVCHGENSHGTDIVNFTRNIIMGGHIWMKRFTPGSHSGRQCRVRHCSVSVMGGEFPEFYLSGLYRSNINTNLAIDDSPHCYTNGGRFGIMAGAATETVKKDVVFEIDHSIIREFYGGGCNAANPVEGNIYVTINNSLVLGKYCGGPKVGEMKVGKNVVTTATNTHFLGNFFGGGNGGTNLYRQQLKDETPNHMPTQSEWDGTYGFNAFNPVHGGSPFNEELGYYAEFEFEVFNQSNGLSDHAVARTYQHWAQFGTTRTGNVTNTLTDCIIEGDFYGGGYLGNVGGETLGDKTVTSVLTADIVHGNIFGAGFSASIPTFPAHDKSKVFYPRRDAAGVVIPGSVGYVTGDDGKVIQYEWCYKNPSTNEVIPSGVEIPASANTTNPVFEYPAGSGKWYCLTTKSLENLGLVSGTVTLTLNNCIVGTMLENGQIKPDTGNVFGGGNESAVSGDTELLIKDHSRIFGNIYGGGNMGKVNGKTKVIVNGQRNN